MNLLELKKPNISPARRFVCTFCDFKTSHKNDWNRHLTTTKHQRRVQKQEKLKLCKFCKRPICF